MSKEVAHVIYEETLEQVEYRIKLLYAALIQAELKAHRLKEFKGGNQMSGKDSYEHPLTPVNCNICDNKGKIAGHSDKTICSRCVYGTSWKQSYYIPIKES
jgi:ribosomal protein S27AE